MRVSPHVLTVAAILVATSPAQAHRLIVDPRVVGDQVKVEAFYEDDTPAQNAKVTVWLDKEKVAEGRTDEKGVWKFPKPAPGTYTVRVEDLGHAGKELLVISDPKVGSESPTHMPEPAADVPSRDEKTGPRWGRVAIGVGVIGGLVLLWRLRLRMSRAPGA
jgi:hypothetical protein